MVFTSNLEQRRLIGKLIDYQRILQKEYHKGYPKFSLLVNKYNWPGLNYPSGKDDQKSLIKIIQELLLMCYMLKMNIYLACISNNTPQIKKNKEFF